MSQKKWRVTWEIDVESDEINSPEEAAQNCYDRIRDHATNDWVWLVYDVDEEKSYEVDYCDYYPEPKVTEL